MRTSTLSFLIVFTASAPAFAEVMTETASATAAASPWIVLGALAIVRTFVCFMESSEDFEQ